MVRVNPYNQDLDKNPANFVPLSPLTYLQRSAMVYGHKPAVIHGSRVLNWGQVYERCVRLGSALSKRGIGVGDTVAAMLPNIPAQFEMHFGVAMCGAVVNTMNIRLDADAIAFTLRHGEARVLFTDREFSATIAKALAQVPELNILVVDVDDDQYQGGEFLGSIEYEDFLKSGDPDFKWQLPGDEWDAISLNYTSGTTGNPKGVVYHHRGAYLNAAANALTWGMPQHSVYLWTLPMFHCNGWCFPWTMALIAGVNICLRKVDPALIFELIKKHQVTHFCGAPIVHAMLINNAQLIPNGLGHPVAALIAGAAPPAAIIEGMEKIGVSITHVYGLTETYGPASVCYKHEEWNSLSAADQARMNGRQGIPNLMEEAMTVMDADTMLPVPADGETMGEIMFRGNIVMKGYLKNKGATEESFRGGWFHSGDLAVCEADQYAKIKDRSKDIIISGGENISSVEVEDVLYRHPSVLVAAVVAKPDEKWGEVPCAFVELKEGAQADEQSILEHCRAHMARFKVPKQVIFATVPKTSTGKIQKFLLRAQVKSIDALN